MEWLRCPTSEQLHLLTSSVNINVNAWLADVTYTLTYVNKSNETLNDVQFTFPVDDSSAVYEMEAELNDTRIVCECREKKEAEATYRAAVESGFAATFLSELGESSDLFSCYLGNVSAGDEVKIKLSVLVEMEAPEVGVAALTIMRVVVPRYRPSDAKQTQAAEKQGTWMQQLQLAGRVSGLSLRQIRCNQGGVQWNQDTGSFEIVKISNGCDIEISFEYELSSSGQSGSIVIFREGGVCLGAKGSAEGIVAAEGAVSEDSNATYKADKDFCDATDKNHKITEKDAAINEESVTEDVSITKKDAVTEDIKIPASGNTTPVGAIASASCAFFQQEVAMLTCFLPDSLVMRSNEESHEVVIVIDRSGSMSGSNIKAAKEALLLFLKSLPATCLFNVVSFGSSFETLFPKSRPYSERTLKDATRLQESMQANMGGTQIKEPLQWVFNHRSSSSSQLTVLLITDGEVGNVQAVKDLVQSQCQKYSHSRVSCIGIGHGASTSLVKGVARVGRGQAEFIRDDNLKRLRRAVISLLKENQLQPLEDVQVSVETLEGQSVLIGTVPSELSNLPASLRINLFVLISQDADGNSLTVRLRGRVGSTDCCIECPSVPPANAADPCIAVVHRAAARLQLKAWTDDNQNGEYTLNIVQLSTAANLSSQYTAFVGVDRHTKREICSSVAFHEEEPEYHMSLMACGLADIACDFDFEPQATGAHCNFKSMAMPPGKTKSKSMFSFLPSLPSLPSFGNKLRSLRRSKSRKSSSLKSPATNENSAGTASAAGIVQSGNDALIIIAQEQCFDGHWECNERLAATIQMNLSDMQDTPDSVSRTIWATALVYAYLTTQLQQLKSEWELIADKALNFVRNHCSSADSIIDKARDTVAATGAADDQ